MNRSEGIKRWLFGLSLWIAMGCGDPSIQLYSDQGSPWQQLAQYGFFNGDLHALDPAEGVLPYDLKTPLFSNYADKARFIWMPQDSQAVLLDNGEIHFPVHTALIKNFFYYHSFQAPLAGRTILETRLLIKDRSGWRPQVYIWNEAQTEASLKIIGGIEDISWIDKEGRAQSLSYVIPDINQCMSCHEQGKVLKPIGPKVGNLDRTYPYDDGLKNQLEQWHSLGYLPRVNTENYPMLAGWQDESLPLNARARAYLEINCGTCHSRAGSAYTSGLYLTSSESRPANLGMCKSPVSAGKGSGGRSYDIVPGQPEASILLYRMEVDDPGARMPEVGRQIAHTEGIALVSQWILDMQGSCEN